ncbi:DUF2975 domain-containing protein [uncultured Intestinimonas sp.]|uniref:DUF2975 domain-containing protein n=1 Tax=uncultured Intestinimonas sp. TaxID=1689265 RepID=UPI0025FCDC44|nr:DUF2975 domain-containing protein [uncultured Intestinimonas sp.]
MENTGVQKLAGVLKVLVTVTIACNLLALFLVPGLALLKGFGPLLAPAPYEAALELPTRSWMVFVMSWIWVWRSGAYDVVLTLFLLFCGCCTAVILWQGRQVLDTILAGTPFSLRNAVSLRRAGLCCLLISGAALLRLVWGLLYYRSPAPLLTYNALFVPIFLMAGLLCQVMSALFRQAEEMKAENDLTI